MKFTYLIVLTGISLSISAMGSIRDTVVTPKIEGNVCSYSSIDTYQMKNDYEPFTVLVSNDAYEFSPIGELDGIQTRYRASFQTYSGIKHLLFELKGSGPKRGQCPTLTFRIIR